MTITGRIKFAYSRWISDLSRLLVSNRSLDDQWSILLERGDGALTVSARDKNVLTELGTLPHTAHQDEADVLRAKIASADGKTAGGNAMLRLSDTCAVERTIQIPKAARDVMAPVIHNQIDRIAPWSEENTLYGFQIRGDSERSSDMLDVHVVATSREILSDAYADAQRLGIEPSVVDYKSSSSGEPIVLVSSDPDRLKRAEGRVRSALSLGFAASIAAATAGSYLAIDQHLRNEELATTLEASKQRIAALGNLGSQNLQLRQQRDRLVQRKASRPAAVALMDVVSRTLPDSAYLKEFELSGGETRLVGKSADPTALITPLEDTVEFEEIRFSAPTTREQGETLATFSIVGQLSGAPKERDQ